MKKILSLLVLTALVVAGCNKYDDSDLQRRVAALETSMNQLIGYKDLLAKLDAGKTVTAFSQSGNEITLTFSDGKTITFNQKGDKGDPGESIQGNPGTPGVSPQVKIEGESWMVSYDEGKTWTNIGSAIDRSLIKDIKLNDAGDALLITLANDEVLSVPYGEKEGYSFIVGGGRKGYAFYESLETEYQRRITVPYVLTGDLTNIEDVEFVTNITNLGSQYLCVDYAVFISPTDAKSGNIILQRLTPDPECEYGVYSQDFPGMHVAISAVFPDGSTRVQQFDIISSTMYYKGVVLNDEHELEIKKDESGSPSLFLPAEAGSILFAFEYWPGSSENYDKYDGEPFTPFAFSDLFAIEGEDAVQLITGMEVDDTQQVWSWPGSCWGVQNYFTVKFSANPSSKERTAMICLRKFSEPGWGPACLELVLHQAPKE